MTRNGLPSPKRESALFHPVVADWLTAQGFNWLYEPIISETRHRVDFLATRGDETWLVECKLFPAPSYAIAQLNGYYTCYGDKKAKKILVHPADYVPTSWFQNHCEHADIRLVAIDGDFSNASPLPRRNLKEEYPERCTGKIAHDAEFARLKAIERRLVEEWLSCQEILDSEGDRAFHIEYRNWQRHYEQMLGYTPTPPARTENGAQR